MPVAEHLPTLLPQHTAEFVGEQNITLPGDTTHECQGSTFHSPRPVITHQVEGPNGETVWLCGVCRDKVAVLAAVLKASNGEPPWPVRREFGNILRGLAMRMWSEHA